MIRKVQIEAMQCTCNLCDYIWLSLATKEPDICRNTECRSREWNGKKTKRKPARGPSITLPKPPKVKWIEEETDL